MLMLPQQSWKSCLVPLFLRVQSLLYNIGCISITSLAPYQDLEQGKVKTWQGYGGQEVQSNLI